MKLTFSLHPNNCFEINTLYNSAWTHFHESCTKATEWMHSCFFILEKYKLQRPPVVIFKQNSFEFIWICILVDFLRLLLSFVRELFLNYSKQILFGTDIFHCISSVVCPSVSCSPPCLIRSSPLRTSVYSVVEKQGKEFWQQQEQQPTSFKLGFRVAQSSSWDLVSPSKLKKK